MPKMITHSIDGQGLLTDIIENPDDDTPRLIYADWCQDNNKPMRAKMLHMQGRYEWHPPEPFGQKEWRLFWCVPGYAGILLSDKMPPAVPCQYLDCKSGFHGQVFIFGAWMCFPCAAREATKRHRGNG